MNQIASENAPSPKVVVPHYIFGGLTLLVISLLVVFHPGAFTQHYFNPKLLAISHLLALGWISMIIFGALYQLLPVILEVKLYSEILAKLSFVLLSTGTILLAFSFWRFSFDYLMFIAGSSVVTSVVLFVVNTLKTAYTTQKKIVERIFIISSAYWLLFTVSAGLTLALNLAYPFLKVPHTELLKLHVHAGIAGWFLQLIIGVSTRLLPMFMVTHNLKAKKLYYTFFSVNLGLIAGLVSLYLQIKTGVVVSALLIVSGIIVYLLFLIAAYKNRVKKQLDIGMKLSALSYAILVIPLFLIFVLLFDSRLSITLTMPLSIAYGSAIILGFITSLVMGQTYKTLPFIVWLKVYRGKVGKVILPLPKDLYFEKVAVAQTWFFAIGFAVLLSGISAATEKLVMAGGIVLLLSVALYNFNIFKIVFHKPKSK